MPLHPSFKAFLEGYHLGPDISELSPAENRQRIQETFTPPALSDELKSIETENKVIQLDDVNLPIRIYRSKNVKKSSLIWIHGGGFMLGSVDGSDPYCRFLAEKTNHTIISIEYRLAPEFPFPTATEDCFSICKWIMTHTDELEIDPKEITIGGSSAGATLATIVCLMWRDKKINSAFKQQLLIMPSIDSRQDYPSFQKYGKDHLVTIETMQYFLDHYVKDKNDLAHPYCLPINAPDLSNIPPAIIAVAECDPLHDEGVYYAEQLKASNVPARLIDLNGVYHGFLGHLLENEFAQNALMEVLNVYMAR